ncbi:MAG: class I SAM-dependent methyltransferase [Planctomycetota bacterium]|jgi:SAM-dependent methyltransferase
MKIRDSGMPNEQTWGSFFNPQVVLDKLGLTSRTGDVVEFGCGYGTFTIAAARIVSGVVHALDIEPEMIETTRARAAEAGLANIVPACRDFLADGTGLADASADYAMVFNILHLRQPLDLLHEALRTLTPGGLLGLMHWNYDPATPRGPAMEIRCRPQQCRQWAEQAGFEMADEGMIDLPPHHWGMVLRKGDRPLLPRRQP